MTKWEKRAFNALSLLLSAGLGFGIGFLCDRIGLFARGTILRNRPHSVEEVCVDILFILHAGVTSEVSANIMP